MRINRNYRSKDPFRLSGTHQQISGEAAAAVSEGRYHEDQEELENLRKKYELYRESDRELWKIEEEQEESRHRILCRIRELREKVSETEQIYELEELESVFRRLEREREEAGEERGRQKRLLLGEIEDREARCREYEIGRGKKEWD